MDLSNKEERSRNEDNQPKGVAEDGAEAEAAAEVEVESTQWNKTKTQASE